MKKLFLLLSLVSLIVVANPEHPEPLRDAKQKALFAQAKQFVALVEGRLSSKEIKALQGQCRKDSKFNIFCYSIKRFTRLKKKAKEKTSRIAPPLKKKPVAPKVVIAKGKIQRWNHLRTRTKPRALVKAVGRFNGKDLNLLGKKALSEKRCPNPMAIAVAAGAEDWLNQGVEADWLAKLYVHGARCAKGRPKDHEHYLTRAGLFYFLANDFKKAETTLARVTPVDYYGGRVLYWLYQTQLKQKKIKAAETTRARLLKEHPFSFHAAVAYSESQIPHLVPEKRQRWQTRSKRHSKVNYLIKQAEILQGFGFHSTAAIVVHWALTDFRTTEPKVKVHLIRMGDAETKVSFLPDLFLKHPELISDETLRTAYPLPYESQFEANAEELDIHLLFALARKESLFDPNAISIAAAKGLMQLAPATSRRLSSEKDPDLFDPGTNIALGSKFIRQLLKKFDGKLYLVLAAYNAGEHKALQWKEHYPIEDPILFTDLIPYRETRDYVGYVLSNYYWYLKLYSKDSSRLLANWLKPYLYGRPK